MSVSKALEAKLAFVQELRQMPIAINTVEANEQHYEVPTPYYLLVLGKVRASYCWCWARYASLQLSVLEQLSALCLHNLCHNRLCLNAAAP